MDLMADSGGTGMEKKRVVVVGGGVAGSLAARILQRHANVVLVDSKEYFEIPWANLRSRVEPLFAEKSIFNHTEYLPNAEVIVSSAANITESEVLTAQGHHIAYDYLIIATGHVDRGPQSKMERINGYLAEHEKLKSSNSVLIAGGGPTGVELAGEIAVDFPEKKVTLVHRGSRLLEFIGPKAGKKALEWLRSEKVSVIMGQSINLTSVSDGVYQTSGGESISADCFFDCTGKDMGSLWLKQTILKDSLDIHGRLIVDENMRVKGHKNVFGIGDITDVPELKQGHSARRHAMVAAKNLKLLLSGGAGSGMAIYRPARPVAFVSLGRNQAVAQIFCLAIMGSIPGMIKSKGLFVKKTRKRLGLKPDPA
ncbi:uncharacterized protein LOC127786829 [Diospyros lotus]|uniref:uncharacterized protein LOC127786829 n=1 Tax=Diospyros lotus TaxID=55363 RepID=UPI00224EBE46|nr:uncharacterized protein LOC127786829 [Diospyros lotus]